MRSLQISKPRGPFEIVERDIPEPGSMIGHFFLRIALLAFTNSFSNEVRLFPKRGLSQSNMASDCSLYIMTLAH